VTPVPLVSRVVLITVGTIALARGTATLFGKASVLLGAVLRVALLLETPVFFTLGLAALLGAAMFLGALSFRVRAAPVVLGTTLRLAVLLGAALVGTALGDQPFLAATVVPIGGAQISGPTPHAIVAELDGLFTKDDPAVVRAVVPAPLDQVRRVAAIIGAGIVLDTRRDGFDVLRRVVGDERALGVCNTPWQRGHQHSAQAERPERALAQADSPERPKRFESHGFVLSNTNANPFPVASPAIFVC
jgi:hypothetical protein